MIIVTEAKKIYYPVDMAGKRRIGVRLDSGEVLILKYVIYPSSMSIQNEVNKYEAWKAAEPARLLAEKEVRVKQEMAELGIVEAKEIIEIVK